MIEVFVEGDPQTKGSYMVIPGNRYPIAQRSKALRVWEKAVREGVEGFSLIPGPVVVGLDFHLPRPLIKKVRPQHKDPLKRHPVPERYPDVDKLTRAVLDGLKKGEAYEDDARVILLLADKLYADPTGCDIKIWGIQEVWEDPTVLYHWLESRIEGP